MNDFSQQPSDEAQIISRLADYGFVLVSRAFNAEQNHKDFHRYAELWRLDKPQVRAYYGADVKNGNSLSVLFDNNASAHKRLRVDQILKGASLPYCNDVSTPHARLSRDLDKRKVPFFIMPAQSTANHLVLQGAFSNYVTRKESYDRVAAAIESTNPQARSSFNLSLRVPTKGDQLIVQLHRVQKNIKSAAHEMSFAAFIKEADKLIPALQKGTCPYKCQQTLTV